MYSFRAVNDIRNATGSIFRPHEMYFVYLAEYTLLFLFQLLVLKSIFSVRELNYGSLETGLQEIG